MRTLWIRTAAVIAILAVAAAVVLWDADPVIQGELAARRALLGADALLPYPSAMFPGAHPRHAEKPSGNRVVIPACGINVAVVRAKSADAGLPYGIWLDPAGSTPGSGEPVVLAGHRIRSRFASLHLVTAGDPVIVYWNGTELDYRVTAVRTILADNGIDLARDAPGNGERLVLYTCLPRWMGNKRTVVTAVPVTLSSAPTMSTP